MEDLQVNRCITNIKQVGHELITMEEDMITDDEELKDLIRDDLRIKATYMYLDFNKVISHATDPVRKLELTRLGNLLIHLMEELGNAVKRQKVVLMQDSYNEINKVIREITPILKPSPA